MRAPSFTPLAGLLLLAAAQGCGGALTPADAGHDSRSDGGIGNFGDGQGTPAEVRSCGNDGGMQCGAWVNDAAPIAGTCTYPLPCNLIGDDRIGVLVNGSSLPQDQPGDSWSYADTNRAAVVINGQLCTDILNGATIEVTILYLCGIP